ncbi:D(4) dopamine receptor-like [Pollicipes pollicipes]|uniref:D(4) dopamine receptor-like n=1 Tax=Pollicipes pollicipes TaxID=41117 RepID=UPI0018858FE2|nr:D(4) dopamine receptor-like [Pollicipes pollicipes]
MSAPTEIIIGLVMAANSGVPVVSILRRRQLREATMYRLLASMASAQALVGVISAVLGTLRLLPTPPPDWACASLLFLRSALGTSTVVSLLALSVERYVTVVHGLRYFDIVTNRHRLLLLAASWLVAALFWAFGMALRGASGDDSDMCNHWESIPSAFRGPQPTQCP